MGSKLRKHWHLLYVRWHLPLPSCYTTVKIISTLIPGTRGLCICEDLTLCACCVCALTEYILMSHLASCSSAVANYVPPAHCSYICICLDQRRKPVALTTLSPFSSSSPLCRSVSKSCDPVLARCVDVAYNSNKCHCDYLSYVTSI